MKKFSKLIVVADETFAAFHMSVRSSTWFLVGADLTLGGWEYHTMRRGLSSSVRLFVTVLLQRIYLPQLC